MNRTIKFRGRDAYGKYRYGFYVECSGISYITENHDGDEVAPDTVAQLVGYDKNGKEVYEGDTIAGENGYETVVYYHDNPDFVRLHTLKEQSA